MRRKIIILRLVLLGVVAVFVSDADASGKKKHKKSAHDHLHVKDIDAAENPREFIDNKQPLSPGVGKRKRAP